MNSKKPNAVMTYAAFRQAQGDNIDFQHYSLFLPQL